jgi:hypothetical protein
MPSSTRTKHCGSDHSITNQSGCYLINIVTVFSQHHSHNALQPDLREAGSHQAERIIQVWLLVAAPA